MREERFIGVADVSGERVGAGAAEIAIGRHRADCSTGIVFLVRADRGSRAPVEQACERTGVDLELQACQIPAAVAERSWRRSKMPISFSGEHGLRNDERRR